MTSILSRKNKYENKLNDKMSKVFSYLLKMVLICLKYMFKATISGFKMPENKRILIFILLSITILSYINIAWLQLIFIFTLRGIYLDLKNFIKNHKNIKNKRKYKRLCSEIFNNKITITDVDDNKITMFSNELTLEEIIKSKGKIELYFNRQISFIKRHPNNFRYTDLYFLQKTAFKNYYRLDEYINTIEKKELNKLRIPAILGINESQQIELIDFAQVKNLFIAGEPGGGKSVLTNILIQSLMVFNSSIFVMVDMKEGVELSDYDHFKNTVVVSNQEEFINVIGTLKNIMTDRLQKIRKTENCKNYFDYNAKKNTENMPEIFLIIDELAEIKLNATSKGRSDEETDLLQLGQKARAAGIYIVGATQRPSGEQVNTDVRAIFQKAISFCISTKETQRMTKISGTENLKPGEFKTNIWNNTNKIYKSLLVLSEENKKAGLPKCNIVYEDLKHIIQNEKFFIKVLEKEKTNVNSLWKRITTKLNKGYPNKLVHYINYHDYIKIVPSAVKKQITDIKKLVQNDNNSIENPQIIHGDNYFLLLKFLLENKQDNMLIPNSKIIMEKLNLSKRNKDDLLKKALEDGYIKKRSKTRSEINFNNPKWAKIKN